MEYNSPSWTTRLWINPGSRVVHMIVKSCDWLPNNQFGTWQLLADQIMLRGALSLEYFGHELRQNSDTREVYSYKKDEKNVLLFSGTINLDRYLLPRGRYILILSVNSELSAFEFELQ
jgi:hypothetical protein